MRRIFLGAFVACLYVATSGANAQPAPVAVPVTATASPTTESVVLKRQAELREAPGDSSRSLVTVAANTLLTRLPLRQGPWIQVRTAQGVTGYVHMFDIAVAGSAASTNNNSGNSAGNAAAGALRGLTGFFNRGSAQSVASTPTSTIGIRGLEAEELARATPNPGAVVMAESNRADAPQAQAFAAAEQLTPRTIDPLPVPASASRPAPANNTSPGGVSFGRDSSQ